MQFDLTPEQRQAALANGGMPLHIHDTESQKVFLLIEQGVEPKLDEEYIREGLQVAREQIVRGEIADRGTEGGAEGGIEVVIAEANDSIS